jgi:hypothetical protein
MHFLHWIYPGAIPAPVSLAQPVDPVHRSANHASKFGRIFRSPPLPQKRWRFIGREPCRSAIVLLWRAEPRNLAKIRLDLNFGWLRRAAFAEHIPRE